MAVSVEPSDAAPVPPAAGAGGGACLTAAMCKRSNRVARVLAYALLEWILIALLLANGVFSCLIAWFAAFCGLPPPCALCSRLGVDSLFSSPSSPRRRGGGAEPLRRVVCDAHAAEMSRLGYCRAHRRLADAADMCEDCGTTTVAASGKELLSWMRRSELGEQDLACACCGVALESGFYSPPFLLPRPAERDLDCGSYKQDGTACLHRDVVFVSEDGPVIELFDEKPLVEDDSIGVMAAHSSDIANRLVPLESIDSLAVGVPEAVDQTVTRDYVVPMNAVNANKEKFGMTSGDEKVVDHGTVPRDYVAPMNGLNANEEKFGMISDDEKVGDMVDRLIDGEITALAFSVASMENELSYETKAGETAESLADQRSPQGDNGLKDKYLEISIGDEMSEDDEQVQQGAVKYELFSVPSDAMEHGFVVDRSDGNTEEVTIQEAENQRDTKPMEGGSCDSEVSIENTEVKHVDEEFEGDITAQAESQQELDSVALDTWEQVTETSSENTENNVEQPELKHLSTYMEAGVLEFFRVNTTTCKVDIEVDPTVALLPSLHQLSDGHSISSDKSSPDCSDVEDKRVSDTPTHIEGISYLQEYPEAVASDTKSVDSSVATMSTDLESVELVTVDQLKSALAGARKSLSTLYAELENERSAAAIAADETMAMINRLQEQKAAMQMEAMQYQRLMEEQSEYDQEALQRLNDLAVKRDKERQDMERELELYRHKIHLYEAKERRKLSGQKVDDQNGSSSASSSAEDSDDLSQSFYEGDESAHGLNGSNGSIPTDVVLHETTSHIVTIDGSLADCEEERLSILEQLKVLEERLFDLEDEESDNMKTDKLFSEDNHLNGASNGFSDDDISFKLHESRRGASYSRKKLLPLFDDATVQNDSSLLTKQYTEADPSAEVVLELAKEQDKIAIASEIDQVHERLHALEADKEFIKQCVRSLNKGGKGFALLQEILQHLRDLRRIEQRARNSGELSPDYVHPYTD
uniref:Uncharacterized protein n=1 Tax=Avena sativa TaxID=4498 RepID=A0ACD5W9D9_AVESA